MTEFEQENWNAYINGDYQLLSEVINELKQTVLENKDAN